MVVGNQLGLVVIQGFADGAQILRDAVRVTREEIFVARVQALPFQGVKVGEGRGDAVDFQQAGHGIDVGIAGARIDFIGQVKAGATQHGDTQHCRKNQQHDVSDNGHGEELLMTLH